MYIVHNAGKTRKIPMSARAGARKASARGSPRPATSIRRGRCTGGVRVSAVDNVRLAHRGLQCPFVGGRRHRWLDTTDHVRGRLLNERGNLGIIEIRRSVVGDRQRLVRDE